MPHLPSRPEVASGASAAMRVVNAGAARAGDASARRVAECHDMGRRAAGEFRNNPRLITEGYFFPLDFGQ